MGIPIEGSTLSLVAIDLCLRIHRIQSQSSGRNTFPLLSISFESATRQKFIRLILHFVLQHTSAFWNICRIHLHVATLHICILKHLHFGTSAFWNICILEHLLCRIHLRWLIYRNVCLQSSWHICRMHVYSDTFADLHFDTENICILTHLQDISAVTNIHERLLAILLR